MKHEIISLQRFDTGYAFSQVVTFYTGEEASVCRDLDCRIDFKTWTQKNNS